MGSTYWFLVKFENGRPEICSMLYESKEEAMEEWNKNPYTTVCETIFGMVKPFTKKD